ncbi:hypothetical protein QQF64_011258 [Cirrhinus molitorella]|uniref:Uncharacterized protein n=1 Tax=Cirrhinus molitorella TaxID=172907 RepID=A0ABR3M238_9TELE
MAKRQLLPSSPEKKRQKEPVNETLCAMVADELKLQFGVVREIFKEEFHPIAERIRSLEKEMRLISNNFDNVQTAVTHRGSTSLLQTPTEVEAYIDQQQELATPQPLGDSTLAGMLTDASA